jgi:3-oxoadipate enol-lactonase
MATFSFGGADLYYETHGLGPAVVFAHGAGGNHLSWWQQVPAFQDRYTCVTFDHRGFGQSIDPRPPSERPRFDEDLAALVDHLELQDIRLVAQSMGGWTCLGYAATHPERVKGVVMADTPGGLTSPAIEAARDAGRKAIAADGLLVRALGDKFREADPAGTFLYGQIFDLNPPRDVVPAAMQRLTLSNEQIKRLTMPVLFIEGADDVIVTPDVIGLASEMVPGSRVQLVGGAGHSVYFEKPDEFNRILDTFLSSVG